MRVHIHNPEAGIIIPAKAWDAACARAGIAHQVSIGADRDSFAAALADGAVAVITGDPAIRRWLAEAPPSLKVISFTNAGLDFLGPFDWIPPGVKLLNNAGAHALKAGEFLAMALLMLANRMPRFADDQRLQRWAPVRGNVLAGRHVTFVGVGAIGGRGAHWARQFGMRVTGVRASGAPHEACDRVVRPEAIDSVLPDTEFLVLAAPHTAASEKLINRDRLLRLPQGAAVVNIGRGPVLDQEALADLLDSNHLSGAMLDVFEQEPIPVHDRLWRTPGLVITPHISAADPRTYVPISLDVFLKNLAAIERGAAPPNWFQPDRGY